MVFQDYCAMMTLDRTRTEQSKAELIYTYNWNLQEFFHVTIANTGSVRISAIKLLVI